MTHLDPAAVANWPPPDPHEIHVARCRGRWTLAYLSDWDDCDEHGRHWDTESLALLNVGWRVTSSRMRVEPVPTPGRA